VINAGVQGYGPVDEWFFFDRVVAAFEADIVLIVVFVANDAIEAADHAHAFEADRPIVATAGAGERTLTLARRIVRSSLVLQYARVRWDQLRARLATGVPERPLATYLTEPPSEVARGLDVSRQVYARIAARAAGLGATTGLVFMPARFQTDDPDYGRLAETVRQAGGVLDRQAASRRFAEATAPLGLPAIDLQPALAAQPDRIGLFFRHNVHLTPRGHGVVADALFDFLRATPAFRRFFAS
jgi:hypothetical protein